MGRPQYGQMAQLDAARVQQAGLQQVGNQANRLIPPPGWTPPTPAEMEKMQSSYSPSMAPGYSWDSKKGKGVKIPGWEEQQLLRP